MYWFCAFYGFVSSDPQIPDQNGMITVPITRDNLSQSNKKSRNAVVLLVHKFDQGHLHNIIKMLDKNMNDHKQTDIIIFHHHYPFNKEMGELRGNTTRYIDFANVDICLSRAPNMKDGFDLFNTNPTWHKRGKWSYHSMIRFWFYDVFHLNVMKNVEYYMRIDDDSKFNDKFNDVFDIMRKRNGK